MLSLMKATKSVAEYIAQAPRETQEKLNQLRIIIKNTAPHAEEKISYGMPFYSYKGRLVYFGLMKKHIGLYIPPPIIEQHKINLNSYETTKSAVHLDLRKELPMSLIKTLVIARMKWNEEVEKKNSR